ncbi:hypothetical protein E2P81_ATG02079 [Venturia nashicola]|uniref:Uncharacterized protein n=1 Tax=Venturia nashicola TaxID=86259 RepID=A0A4Z1PLL7_9PEZI|nr:hypothetical protein E6O75_ATG02128 [Venturia nashicola]TLD35776.1 hypothetical protein E2P81_ATG02079 [Venturia nashicola]
MATMQPTRQPLGGIDPSRLQALSSMKNRQNAISVQDTLSPAATSTSKPSQKRRYEAASPYTDDFDSENVDPSTIASPFKKAKGFNGTPVKSSTLSLVDAIPKSSGFTTPFNSPAVSNLKRKNLSLSVPTTTNPTPISRSRGSPKHKRVGILSKGRRFSSSPFRRFDPPKFNSTSTGLPFSIDAALSGTISSYKPATPIAAPALPEPVLSSRDAKSMPSSWFFDIHEDTAEEEAANLMEHSTLTLDISSDDDCDARKARDIDDRGKENVPPPDWTGPTLRRAYSAPAGSHKGIHSEKKAMQLVEKLRDVMQEDRAALGSLNAEDFYPDGLDDKSVVLVAEPAVEKEKVVGKKFEEYKETKTSVDAAARAETLDEKTVDVAVKEKITVTEQETFIRPDSHDLW